MSHKRRKYHSPKIYRGNWKPPIPSGQLPVNVQSVSQTDAVTLQWRFTANVSSAPANVPQLLASGDGSTYQAPTAVTTSNGGLAATYSGPVLSPGCVYSVMAPPTGVTFAAGNLSVPQTGTVISQQEAQEATAQSLWLAEVPTSKRLKLRPASAKATPSKKPTRRAA
jgi:hypothetical protein